MVPDRLRPRNNPDRTSATGALNSAVTEIATDEPPVRPSHSSLGRSMSAAAFAYGSGSGPEWSWCLASPHGAWLGAWPDYSKLGGWRFTASRTRTRGGGISTFLCTRLIRRPQPCAKSHRAMRRMILRSGAEEWFGATV